MFWNTKKPLLLLAILVLASCNPSKSSNSAPKPGAGAVATPGSIPGSPSNFAPQTIALGSADSRCPPYVYEPNYVTKLLDPNQLPNLEGIPRDLKTISPDLDPYGFGCYGSCGASCNITLRDIPPVDKVYRVRDASGVESLRVCSYKRSEGLSDLRCRKHDDCYRKVDLEYYKTNKDLSKPPTTLGTTGYRVCDVTGPFLDEAWKIDRWFKITDPSQLTAQERNLCFANYAIGNVQTGIGDCWDGSTIKYADLMGEQTISSSDPRAANAISYP